MNKPLAFISCLGIDSAETLSCLPGSANVLGRDCLGLLALILDRGMSVRKIKAPGVEELQGIGVFYGSAITEAATYKGEDVCIVGGANSAGQGAIFFSRYAKSVTILMRANELGVAMSQYLVDSINVTPNIRVIPNVEVSSVSGSGKLEKVVIKKCNSGEEIELKMAAMFIYIGTAPHSEMVEGFVPRDQNGFILTGPDLPKIGNKPKGWTLGRDPFLLETNVPGVFAIGDVRSGANRRVAAAVGEGAASIYMVHKYLQTV